MNYDDPKYYIDQKLSVRYENISIWKDLKISKLSEKITSSINEKDDLIIFMNDCELKEDFESNINVFIEPLIEFFNKYNPFVILMSCKNGILSELLKNRVKRDWFVDNYTSIIGINRRNGSYKENLDFFKNFQENFVKNLEENKTVKKFFMFCMYFSTQNNLKKYLNDSLPTFIVQNNNLFSSLNFKFLKNLTANNENSKSKNIFEISLYQKFEQDRFENNILKNFVKSMKNSPEKQAQFCIKMENVDLLQSTKILATDFENDESLRKIFMEIILKNNNAVCTGILIDFSLLSKKFGKNHLIEMYDKKFDNDDENLFFHKFDEEIKKETEIEQRLKKFNNWLVNGLKELDITFESLNFMFYDEANTNIVKEKDFFFFCIISKINNSAEAFWKFIDHPISYALVAAKIYKKFSLKAENSGNKTAQSDYSKLAEDWEQKAVLTLNNCYDSQKTIAKQMLTSELGKRFIFEKNEQGQENLKETKDSESIITLAHHAESYHFINTQACQERLSEIWVKSPENSLFNTPKYKFIISTVRKNNLNLIF